jgi:hypothetical protein
MKFPHSVQSWYLSSRQSFNVGVLAAFELEYPQIEWFIFMFSHQNSPCRDKQIGLIVDLP